MRRHTACRCREYDHAADCSETVAHVSPRGVGEYGSVIFIAGNMPMVSEIAPLLIVIRLEQLDYAGAAALALVMLLVSFAILLLLNALQARIATHAA